MIPETPDFWIQDVQLPDGRQVRVVRDDIVLGGTKQRVLERMLVPGMNYIYASPAYGYAQIALALACKRVGSTATIFVAKRTVLHDRTQRALDAGATIIEVADGMQTVITHHANRYGLRKEKASVLPLGFAMPEFDTAFDALLADVHIRPKQIFCVVSTGTTYRALRRRWPHAEFHCVQVGMKPRICLDDSILHVAPEHYHKNAKVLPPYPSCSNSDAKVWQYVLEFADAHGALVYNVAA